MLLQRTAATNGLHNVFKRPFTTDRKRWMAKIFLAYELSTQAIGKSCLRAEQA